METIAASRPTANLWAIRLGKTWFEFRSFSPLPFFLLLVILPPQFQPTATVYLVAGAIVVLAEALRIWAVGYAGSVTRTRGDKVPRLIHAGPYRYLRNPLYVANIAMYIAAGVMFGFGWLSFAFFFYFAIQYSFIIRFEESILSGTFGEAYRNYFEAVPRWGLRLPPYQSSGHPFDLKAALRSERSTFYSLTGMVLAFALKEYLFR